MLLVEYCCGQFAAEVRETETFLITRPTSYCLTMTLLLMNGHENKIIREVFVILTPLTLCSQYAITNLFISKYEEIKDYTNTTKVEERIFLLDVIEGIGHTYIVKSAI